MRISLVLAGVVQGVGLRPAICRLARELNLTGTVRNCAVGASVEIQGKRDAIRMFRERLRASPSPIQIVSVSCRQLDLKQETGFHILPSEDSSGSGLTASDLATCEACLSEVLDRAARRHGHPFTTCAQCGPRYTILSMVPFDRPNTSMASFPMCEACLGEYRDNTDRRHHAQTMSCPNCGPKLLLEGDSPATSFEAIDRARTLLNEGHILAIKGIGGFHFACDAMDDGAVRRLRDRKERGDKPFAMMAGSVDIVRRHAHVDPAEERLLTGPERPIVLLRNHAGAAISEAVSPGTHDLGFMLPYTPLHHLLLGDRPLVMTSANLSGEPITWKNEEAKKKFAGIADAILLHNRDIVAPCDDSVMRCVAEIPQSIRRSRGFVPLPITVPVARPVLAVGGDLKGTICLAADGQAFLGPHLGDIEHPDALDLLGDTVERFRALFHIEPECIACDAHPGYHTARWAEQFARRRSIPLVRVQHHRAHVASLLADCGRTDPIIGVCFDGTGYGDDGTICGGEFFAGTIAKLERVGHLAPVPLPGGDAAVLKPYRMALAWLHACGLEWDDALPCVQSCPPAERLILKRQLECNLNCAPTTSVGRLFDAVSSLIGVRSHATYEGQAAIELESCCDDSERNAYEFRVCSESMILLDSGPVVRAIVRDMKCLTPRSAMASRFHRGLARAVVGVCRLIRDRTGLATVGLTGGVFQNVRLTSLLLEELHTEEFEVLIHRHVPPNDGGLSLGQAVLAVAETRDA